MKSYVCRLICNVRSSYVAFSQHVSQQIIRVSRSKAFQVLQIYILPVRLLMLIAFHVIPQSQQAECHLNSLLLKWVRCLQPSWTPHIRYSAQLRLFPFPCSGNFYKTMGFSLYFLKSILEPVGRVSPKFATILTGTMFEVRKNHSYALQCPAQAFPTPLFR